MRAGAAGGVDAVLFDATGTLISVRGDVGALYASLAARHGEGLDPGRVGTAFARALGEAPPLAFPDVPPPALEEAERSWWRGVVARTVAAAAAPSGAGRARAPRGSPRPARFRGADGERRFSAFFDALYAAFAGPGPWRVEPGAREVLAELAARGYALGVLSNFDGRLPGLLAALGLDLYLAAVVTSSSVGAAKPDPRAFRAALSRLGREAAGVAYVGDSPGPDGAGAAAAGLAPVLVRCDPPAGVRGWRVESLDELLDLFPRPGAPLPPPPPPWRARGAGAGPGAAGALGRHEPRPEGA